MVHAYHSLWDSNIAHTVAYGGSNYKPNHKPKILFLNTLCALCPPEVSSHISVLLKSASKWRHLDSLKYIRTRRPKLRIQGQLADRGGPPKEGWWPLPPAQSCFHHQDPLLEGQGRHCLLAQPDRRSVWQNLLSRSDIGIGKYKMPSLSASPRCLFDKSGLIHNLPN